MLFKFSIMQAFHSIIPRCSPFPLVSPIVFNVLLSFLVVNIMKYLNNPLKCFNSNRFTCLNCTANIYLSTFNNRLATTKLFPPPISAHFYHISKPSPSPPSPQLFMNENSNWIPNQANIANGGQPQKGVYQQQMRRPQQVGTLANRCHTRRREERGWGGKLIVGTSDSMRAFYGY